MKVSFFDRMLGHRAIVLIRSNVQENWKSGVTSIVHFWESSPFHMTKFHKTTNTMQCKWSI